MQQYNPDSVLPRKQPRRAVWLAATLLAFVAAIAGGTYALWSTSATFDGGTVVAGKLDLQQRNVGVKWYDISPDRSDASEEFPQVPPSAVPGLSGTAKGHPISLPGWNMVPGDTMLGVVPLRATLTGDNLVASLRFTPPEDAAPWNLAGEDIKLGFYFRPPGNTTTDFNPTAGRDGQPFAYLAARVQHDDGDGDGNDKTYVVDSTGVTDFEVLVVVSLSDKVKDLDHVGAVLAALDGGAFELNQVRAVGAQFGR